MAEMGVGVRVRVRVWRRRRVRRHGNELSVTLTDGK